MKSTKILIIIAGLSGITGVALGAFGAHGLKDVLSPESLETYNTGVFYHLIHTIAILAIAFSSTQEFVKAAFSFLIGIILFSFSLYVYSYTELKLFAIITPFGGISFLIGWVLLIFEGIKSVKAR